MGIIVQNVRGLALVLHVHLLPHLLLHFPVSVHVAYSTTPPKKTLLKRYQKSNLFSICVSGFKSQIMTTFAPL